MERMTPWFIEPMYTEGQCERPDGNGPTRPTSTTAALSCSSSQTSLLQRFSKPRLFSEFLMVRLSVKPRAQTFDDRTGSEVFTLPQAQVTENEKHDYYDANDVEDIIHSDFSPFSTNRRYAYSYGSRRQFFCQDPCSMRASAMPYLVEVGHLISKKSDRRNFRLSFLVARVFLLTSFYGECGFRVITPRSRRAQAGACRQPGDALFV